MNAIAQASAAPTTGPKLDNRRVLAGIVDLLIVGLGGVVVLFAGDALSGDSSDVRGALGAVILGWSLYYYFALESGGGQTVGKKLMKLRVVRADGSPVGMREVAVRTVLRVVDGVGLYIVGLIVMLATGERRQRLGDLAAGTKVVDASAPSVAQAVAAPVTEPVEEAVAEAPNAEAESEAIDEPESEGVEPTPTITLPSRPAPPATISDLSEPEVAEEPVAEEPVAEEPMAEEPLAEEELPEITSPSLEELARDVEAAQAAPAVEVDEPVVEVDEPVVEVDEPVVEVDEPVVEVHEPVEEPVEVDEPMTVKSVETVSAMDLIMGTTPESDPAEETAEGSRNPDRPASH